MPNFWRVYTIRRAIGLVCGRSAVITRGSTVTISIAIVIHGTDFFNREAPVVIYECPDLVHDGTLVIQDFVFVIHT
jgi:hypothetical protein